MLVSTLITRNYLIASKTFDVDDDGALVVDVWDYMERMALYKFMIENFHHCEFDGNAREATQRLLSALPGTLSDAQLQVLLSYLAEKTLNAGSILWGLPLQHGWQFSSGRLLTADNRYFSQHVIALKSRGFYVVAQPLTAVATLTSTLR